MKRLMWAAAVIALTAARGSAQEDVRAEAPMVVKVRPSSVDDPEAAARRREERLQRRLAEADYLFRNICVHCGGGIERPGAYAPFNPSDALRTGR